MRSVLVFRHRDTNFLCVGTPFSLHGFRWLVKAFRSYRVVFGFFVSFTAWHNWGPFASTLQDFSIDVFAIDSNGKNSHSLCHGQAMITLEKTCSSRWGLAGGRQERTRGSSRLHTTRTSGVMFGTHGCRGLDSTY